jgi:formamidopyrimidine-DNA glycosylase
VPELPDAAGDRRLLARSLHHLDRIELVDVAVLRNADPAALDDAIGHQDVEGVERRGKWLVLRLERAGLVIHLGMTGSIVLTGPHEPIAPDDRAVLSGDAELRLRDRRRLGGIWLAANAADVADITGPLGPDAAAITVTQLAAALGRRRTVLKSALMDQTTIAGLGNTLSDEVLWSARLHPATPADSLSADQLATLHTAHCATACGEPPVRGPSHERRRGSPASAAHRRRPVRGATLASSAAA